jgi:hypothetical protein
MPRGDLKCIRTISCAGFTAPCRPTRAGRAVLKVRTNHHLNNKNLTSRRRSRDSRPGRARSLGIGLRGRVDPRNSRRAITYSSAQPCSSQLAARPTFTPSCRYGCIRTIPAVQKVGSLTPRRLARTPQLSPSSQAEPDRLCRHVVGDVRSTSCSKRHQPPVISTSQSINSACVFLACSAHCASHEWPAASKSTARVGHLVCGASSPCDYRLSSSPAAAAAAGRRRCRLRLPSSASSCAEVIRRTPSSPSNGTAGWQAGWHVGRLAC